MSFNALGTNYHSIHEPEILGTAGGIRHAAGLFGPPPLVVWNGDILADPPLEVLAGLAGSGGLAFLVAARPSGEGTVGLGAGGEIVRLRGEAFGTEVSGGDYAGIAALGDRVLAALPHQGCLIGDVALPELRRGGRIPTVTVVSGFRDVGSVGAYHAACLAWLAARVGPDGAWVHPSARVDVRVSLRRTIVGEGAVVMGQGTMDGCVLWPGATAEAPLTDVIVTTAGRRVRA